MVDQEGNPTGRYIYELSDLLVEILRKGFIDLKHLKKFLKEVKSEEKFVEEELEVCRTQPRKYKFGK